MDWRAPVLDVAIPSFDFVLGAVSFGAQNGRFPPVRVLTITCPVIIRLHGGSKRNVPETFLAGFETYLVALWIVVVLQRQWDQA